MGQLPDLNQCSGKTGLEWKPTAQQQIEWREFLGGTAPCPSRFLGGIAEPGETAAAAASETGCVVVEDGCAVVGANCAKASFDCAEAAVVVAAAAVEAGLAADTARAVYAAAAAPGVAVAEEELKYRMIEAQ